LFENKDWPNLATRLFAGFALTPRLHRVGILSGVDFTVAARMFARHVGGHTHGILLTVNVAIALVTAGMILVHWTLRDSNIETA
jgi:hypothetical protein